MSEVNQEGTSVIAPSHQAVLDRIKTEGRVKWIDATGVESRALMALERKGLAVKVFQPYGNTYFELPG